MPETRLAVIDLVVPGSGQRGRAILPVALLQSIPVDDLGTDLAERFIEEDDRQRFDLLEKALAQPAITVETYPGETSPVELHAYIRAPEISEAPLFACVLASSAVIEHLVATPPHVVLESATLQMIADDGLPSSVVSAMEDWIGRVWPDIEVPRIVLRQWPELERDRLLPSELTRPWPRLHLTTSPMRGASPSLSARDFPTTEELQP